MVKRRLSTIIIHNQNVLQAELLAQAQQNYEQRNEFINVL